MSTTRTIACVLLFALVASACGGSSGSDAATPAVDLREPLPTATAELEAPTATATTPADEPADDPEPTTIPATPTPEPPAPPTFWADVLAVGDCFNRSVIADGELPTTVPCDAPHEEEIFAVGTLPDPAGAPYPGEDAVFDAADASLCDAATPAFGGADWTELPYDTAVLFPTETEWNDGDRGIMCSASARDGRVKVGTAAGAGQRTDDVLLYRAGLNHPSVGDFEDWVLGAQFTPVESLISLTDGTLDLQLRRPALLDGGFTFFAHPVGTEPVPNAWYTLTWDDPELSANDVPVDGFEYSGIATRGQAVAFAAREADDADWNLFSITPGDSHIIGDGPGDERFATFTPDGTQIVFQRDGDLWISDVTGDNQRQLTDTAANEWESAVSPDGRHLAFSSDRDGNDDIWLMSIDGGEAVNLTNHPGDDIWPSWSADGTTIYFSSDRFDPVDERTVVMLTDLDGNQSFFSNHVGNQAQPVSAGDAQLAAATFPTLEARYDGDDAPAAIDGTPGELVAWTHSGGRLEAFLPAGWQVVEYDAGIAAFVAGVDPAQADASWASDAIYVTLYEADDRDTFFADRFETALANTSCEAVDELPLQEGSPGVWLVGRVNACGDATGRVAAFFDETARLGVLVEGQSDDLPDATSDEQLLTGILTSIRWQ